MSYGAVFAVGDCEHMFFGSYELWVDTPSILAKKRDGQVLSEEEIYGLVKGIVNGDVGVDQVGAFLMATYINGFTDTETAALTEALMHSGETLKWAGIIDDDQISKVVDKHSTGGVGDKVSLPLAPALVACGCKVPMISGRGLGHTGGTLDKLESIPGYNSFRSPQEVTTIVGQVGGCIVGQSSTLVPGDRILYHTRDVTSTVDSLPLIVASIMSKKLAESPSSLVLDVKVGDAAFMRTPDDGRALARAMVSVGKKLGVNTRALLTEMDCPIGSTIGNALEVFESVECLNGEGPSDLSELVALEGGHLLHQVGLVQTPEEGFRRIDASLKDGSARDSFKQMLVAVGVDDAVVEDLFKDPWSVLPTAPQKTQVFSEGSGYVSHIKAMPLAIAAGNLGAGRKKQTDLLDLSCGIQLLVSRGDKIRAGEAWAVIHHTREVDSDDLERIKQSLLLSEEPVTPQSRLLEVIQ
eukprot:gene3296-5986_t